MREPLLIVDVAVDGDKKSWSTVLRCKNRDGQTVKLRVHGCRPKFWTAKPYDNLPHTSHVDGVVDVKHSDKTSVDGIELIEVEIESPFHYREVRDFYYPHYSADAKWSSAVRWLYGWEAVIEVDTSKDLDKLRPVNIHGSEIPASDFTLDLLYLSLIHI